MHQGIQGLFLVLPLAEKFYLIPAFLSFPQNAQHTLGIGCALSEPKRDQRFELHCFLAQDPCRPQMQASRILDYYFLTYHFYPSSNLLSPYSYAYLPCGALCA